MQKAVNTLATAMMKINRSTATMKINTKHTIWTPNNCTIRRKITSKVYVLSMLKFNTTTKEEEMYEL